MREIIPLLVLVAALPPIASAEPLCHVVGTFPTVTQVCVYDDAWINGDCNAPAPFASESAFTGIVVDQGLVAYAHAGGSTQCWANDGGAGGASSGIAFVATTYSFAPWTAVGAGWQEWSTPGASGCGIYAFVSTDAGYHWHELPCVAGAPPDPGWGSLLP